MRQFLAVLFLFLLRVKLSTSAACVNASLPPFTAQNLVCSTDPGDPSYLEVFVLPAPAACTNTVIIQATVTYTDVLQVVSTVGAISPATVNQGALTTGTLSFSIPLTRILNGAPVTISYTAVGLDGIVAANAQIVYTQTLIPSIVSTVSTTTIPTTVEATAVTTSTLTNTDVSTFTPTLTSVVTTGTRTVLARRSTTTKIATITPHPKTITKVTFTRTTKTISCLPTKYPPYGGHYYGRAMRAEGIQARQAELPNFEPPNCGKVTTTTITNTVVEPTLITTTTTSTVFDYATVTNTITGPPTYVFSSVRATRTITPPPRTITRLTVAPRSTSTTTKTVTLTSTIVAGGKHGPQCKSRHRHVHIPPPPYCSFKGGLKTPH